MPFVELLKFKKATIEKDNYMFKATPHPMQPTRFPVVMIFPYHWTPASETE